MSGIIKIEKNKMNSEIVESSGIKKRMIYFIGYLKIGQSSFEKKTGLSNGLVNNLADNISSKSLIKIKSIYPTINLNWILTGEGEMLISETTSNNSDPPKELREENKKLKEENDDIKNTLKILKRSYTDLSEKYDDLERKYKSLNAEPLRKAAGQK